MIPYIFPKHLFWSLCNFIRIDLSTVNIKDSVDLGTLTPTNEPMFKNLHMILMQPVCKFSILLRFTQRNLFSCSSLIKLLVSKDQQTFVNLLPPCSSSPSAVAPAQQRHPGTNTIKPYLLPKPMSRFDVLFETIKWPGKFQQTIFQPVCSKR